MNKGLTVIDLAKACAEQLKMGNGYKHVLISGDDEGNSFHTLFYLFTSKEESIRMFAEDGLFHDNNDPSEVVILG